MSTCLQPASRSMTASSTCRHEETNAPGVRHCACRRARRSTSSWEGTLPAAESGMMRWVNNTSLAVTITSADGKTRRSGGRFLELEEPERTLELRLACRRTCRPMPRRSSRTPSAKPRSMSRPAASAIPARIAGRTSWPISTTTPECLTGSLRLPGSVEYPATTIPCSCPNTASAARSIFPVTFAITNNLESSRPNA